ncbi:MAG: YkgJ family cysteine cluster protein [Thermodesulfobacteriota bacterium]
MLYCHHCPGYCCYRLPGSRLLIDAADINRLARHFGIRDGEARRRFLEGRSTFRVQPDGACIFLAPDRLCQRCTVHEARPSQCRRFPYGRPCPYLERADLLVAIAPRVEASLRQAWQGRTAEYPTGNVQGQRDR